LGALSTKANYTATDFAEAANLILAVR